MDEAAPPTTQVTLEHIERKIPETEQTGTETETETTASVTETTEEETTLPVTEEPGTETASPVTETTETTEPGTEPTAAETSAPQEKTTRAIPDRAAPQTEQTEPTTGTARDYVLNQNTMRFHKPSCSAVDKIKDKNRRDVTAERDAIVASGYVPCKLCNP